MGTTFGWEISFYIGPEHYTPGWSDIKWGRGDKVALAACKLGANIGMLARYKEHGEVPAGFNKWKYRRKAACQWFVRRTGMVRRTNERYFFYKDREELPTAEELEMTEEVWLNIFTDFIYADRMWHPFVWIAYGGRLVYLSAKRVLYKLRRGYYFDKAVKGLFKED
jgi:hypothetical protein